VAAPYFSELGQEWKTRSFQVQGLVTLLFVGSVLWFLPGFLDSVEQRPGVVLPDPVLNLLPPLDLTWITFIVIYASILAGFILLLRFPQHLLLAFQTYGIVVLFRVLAMWVTPFDPPPAMIALKDPFVEFFGNGSTLTRDLFFSGHTATLFVLCLAMPTRGTRRVFMLSTIVVACCVLFQHVHYTVDVFAAPFFAFGSYKIVLWVRERLTLHLVVTRPH
jgi:hypothetical protein